MFSHLKAASLHAQKQNRINLHGRLTAEIPGLIAQLVNPGYSQ
jgi:hypothetical protein